MCKSSTVSRTFSLPLFINTSSNDVERAAVMADAYCGPSNALQNFQKHTAVDRSLQQDRLTSRRTPLEVSNGLDESRLV